MNGEDVIRRSNAAFDEQSRHVGLWKRAVSYCAARKVYTLNGAQGNSSLWEPDPTLQNGVAEKAAENLAAGICSAFMNPSEIWAQWEPSDFMPSGNKTDRLYQFYENATRVAMRTYGPAGFYSRAYEMILDAVCTGNGALEVMGDVPGSDAPLNCKTYDIGSYAIAENCAGIVNHLWRKVEYTIAQAQAEWPKFNPDTWRGIKDEERHTKTECYIMEIIPRDQKDVGQVSGPKGMPYRYTLVHEPTKEVVAEGGHQEFPVKIYRFQRQSGISPWGTGPGIRALADAGGVNFLDTVMADGIGKQVDPPLVIKDDMRGILDARMAGVSSVANLATDMPQRLFEVGNLQSANEFLRDKKKELREHFFSDLFTPFLNDPRTLKAAQVHEIAKDVLAVFAPFGHRFLEEFVTNFLERVFMVLLRQGLFGPVPPEAIVGGKFLYPKVVHQSRMALEIQNLAKSQVRQLLLDVQPIAAIDPSQLDWLNFPAIIKLLGGGSVVMPGVLNSPEQFAALQAARQAAMQQQQAMEFASKFATKNPDHAADALAAVA